MPSLIRYFVFVGGALTGGLLLVNHMFAPPPAPEKAARAKIVVEHDPHASLIERWRNEQAAMKAAERGEPAPVFYVPPQEPVTPVSESSPTQPEPQNVAPVALKTAPAEPDADEVRKAAERARAARAHKARIARERAERQRRERDETANAQDPFAFGAARSAYADAQRRTGSPFGWTW